MPSVLNKSVSPSSAESPQAAPDKLAAKEAGLAPEVAELSQPKDASPVGKVIESKLERARHNSGQDRAADQRIEEQLYAQERQICLGLAAAICKTAPAHAAEEQRRRVENLHNEMIAHEAEKERKKRSASIRETTFFRALASVIGEKAAESLSEKIEQLQAAGGPSGQRSPEAVAQAAKEIAAALSAGDTLLKLNISTEVMERTLAQELTTRFAAVEAAATPDPPPAAGLFSDAVNASIQAASDGLDADRKDFLRRAEEKRDLFNAIQFNPKVAPEIMQGPKGAELLKKQVESLGSSEAAIKFLSTLKLAVGQEQLSKYLDAFEKHAGRSLILELRDMVGASPEAHREVLRQVVEAKLLSPEQLARLTGQVAAEQGIILARLDTESARRVQLEVADKKILIENSFSEVQRISKEMLGLSDAEVSLSGVPDAEREAKLLGALASRLKDLRGKSLADALKLLKQDTGEEKHLRRFLGADEATKDAILQGRPDPLLHLHDSLEKIVSGRKEIEALEKTRSPGARGEIPRIVSSMGATYGDLPGFDVALAAARKDGAAALNVLRVQAEREGAGREHARDALLQVDYAVLNAELLDAIRNQKEHPGADRALISQFQQAHASRQGALADGMRCELSVKLRAIEKVDALTGELIKAGTSEAFFRKVRVEELQQDIEKSRGQRLANKPYLAELADEVTEHEAKITAITAGINKQFADTAIRLKAAALDRQASLALTQDAAIKQVSDLLSDDGLERAFKGKYVDKSLDQYASQRYDWMAVKRTFGEAYSALDEARAIKGADSAALSAVLQTVPARTAKLSAEEASATGTQTAGELRSKVEGIFSRDPAQESAASIEALWAASSGDKRLEGVLQQVGQPLPPAQQIEALRHKLAYDPAAPDEENRDRAALLARIEVFLVTAKQPEILKQLGLPGGEMAAAELWTALQKADVQALPMLVQQARGARLESDLIQGLGITEANAATILESCRKASGGLSLAERVLALRQTHGDGSLTVRVAGSLLAGEQDLKTLFGSPVPAARDVRRREMERLIAEDSKGLEALGKRLAEELNAPSGGAGSQPFVARLGEASLARSFALQSGDPAVIARHESEAKALERELDKKIAKLTDGLSPELLARLDLQALMRRQAEEASRAEAARLIDPSGPLAKGAKSVAALLSRLEPTAPGKPSNRDVALYEIRELKLSEAHSTILKGLYRQAAAGRRAESGQLSGSLESDLAGGRVFSSEESIRKLLQGGGKVAESDFENAIRAIERGDTHHTVRYVLLVKAQEAREGGAKLVEALEKKIEETAESIRDSEEVKKLQRLLQAVKDSDAAHTLALGYENTAWFLSTCEDKMVEFVTSTSHAVGQRLGQWRDSAFDSVQQLADSSGASRLVRASLDWTRSRYDEAMQTDVAKKAVELGDKTAKVAKAASEWAEATLEYAEKKGSEAALTAYNAAMQRIPDSCKKFYNDALNELSDEKMRISFQYSNDRVPPKGFSGFVRHLPGNSFGEADAKAIEMVASSAEKGSRALSEGSQALAQYRAARERLVEQLTGVRELKIDLEGRLGRTRTNHEHFSSVQHGDRERLFKAWSWERGAAQAVVASNEIVMSSQRELLDQQNSFMRELGGTERRMERRGVEALRAILESKRRLLSLNTNDAEHAAAREQSHQVDWRDLKIDDFKRWSHVRGEALKHYEAVVWRSAVAHTTAKVVVVVGASVFATPATGLAVALAWNATDKTVRYATAQMDGWGCTRHFLIEGATDALLSGIAAIRIFKVRVEADPVFSALKNAAPVSKWGVRFNFFNTANKLNAGGAREVVFHAGQLKSGIKDMVASGGGYAQGGLLLEGAKYTGNVPAKVVEGALRKFFDLSAKEGTNVYQAIVKLPVSGFISGQLPSAIARGAIASSQLAPRGQPASTPPNPPRVAAQTFVPVGQTPGAPVATAKESKPAGGAMPAGEQPGTGVARAIENNQTKPAGGGMDAGEQQSSTVPGAMAVMAEGLLEYAWATLQKAGIEPTIPDLQRLNLMLDQIRNAVSLQQVEEAATYVMELLSQWALQQAEKGKGDTPRERPEKPQGRVELAKAAPPAEELVEDMNDWGNVLRGLGRGSRSLIAVSRRNPPQPPPVVPPAPPAPVAPSSPPGPGRAPAGEGAPGPVMSLGEEETNSYVLELLRVQELERRRRAERETLLLEEIADAAARAAAEVNARAVALVEAHAIAAANAEAAKLAHADADSMANTTAQAQALSEAAALQGLQLAEVQRLQDVELIRALVEGERLRQQEAEELLLKEGEEERLRGEEAERAKVAERKINREARAEAQHAEAAQLEQSAFKQPEPVGLKEAGATALSGEEAAVPSNEEAVGLQETGSITLKVGEPAAIEEAPQGISAEPAQSARLVEQQAAQAGELMPELLSITRLEEPGVLGEEPQSNAAQGTAARRSRTARRADTKEADEAATDRRLMLVEGGAQWHVAAAAEHPRMRESAGEEQSGEELAQGAPLGGIQHGEAAVIGQAQALAAGAIPLNPHGRTSAIEQIEAAMAAIEALDTAQGDEELEQREARLKKKRRSQDRLRAIIMQQLTSRRHEQLKKQRLLALLIALGISEKEYRELVARIGELEAHAKGERERSRRALVSPLARALAPRPAPIPPARKAPVLMREAEAAPQGRQISRAELYVRMKE